MKREMLDEAIHFLWRLCSEFFEVPTGGYLPISDLLTDRACKIILTTDLFIKRSDS